MHGTGISFLIKPRKICCIIIRSPVPYSPFENELMKKQHVQLFMHAQEKVDSVEGQANGQWAIDN